MPYNPEINGEIEEYLDKFSYGSCARFVGFEPFKQLVEAGRIMPNMSIIRVMYIGALDPGFFLNEKWQLIEVGKQNPEPLNPLEFLSGDKNPDGWEIPSPVPKRLATPIKWGG